MFNMPSKNRLHGKLKQKVERRTGLQGNMKTVKWSDGFVPRKKIWKQAAPTMDQLILLECRRVNTVLQHHHLPWMPSKEVGWLTKVHQHIWSEIGISSMKHLHWLEKESLHNKWYSTSRKIGWSLFVQERCEVSSWGYYVCASVGTQPNFCIKGGPF